MSAHPVQWVTAAPLWPATLSISDEPSRSAVMRRPVLLRFDSDSFMAALAAQLQADPAGLAANVATPVTYRLPPPGEQTAPTPTELKLYQPLHGHFNLVAASLVCQLPGLPEREVNAAAGERVRFVLRRSDAAGEWAWVSDPTVQGGRAWKQLPAAGAVDPAEELLPMFPVRYSTGDRMRKLFVGLIPTASGDTFKATGPLSPLAPVGSGSGAPPADPRPSALTNKVTDPLRALGAMPTDAPSDAQDPAAVAQAMADQQTEASRFLLLDFAQFLHDNLSWFTTDPAQPPIDPPGVALWNQLLVPVVAAGSATWIDALATAWSERLIISGDAPGTSSLNLNLRVPGLTPDQLDQWVVAALPPQPAPDPQAPAVSIQGDAAPPPPVPKLDTDGGTSYMIRCVYQRPACGPLQPDAVSDPSDLFQIAGFFDLDAPSRSIVIPMPLNTGIKDLRKLRKNVSFLLSNELRQQINRVTSLKDALDGKFADGQSLDIGLICSFSIPVITICALIVLMIFISLLNIVFWWMPFLRICFPILRQAD